MGNISKHRVAVIGCGNWGKNLVRDFAELGALAAVSDANEETAGSFASRYGVPSISPDCVSVSPDIDAVAIAVPAHDHCKLALEAITAGKHVLVEKPAATSSNEAASMNEAAARHRVVLQVGHVMQYHPCFRALRNLVRNGDIGRIQFVNSTRADIRLRRRHENALWSFAIHDISMLLSLTRELPELIFAQSGGFLDRDGFDVVAAILSFGSGTRCNMLFSWVHHAKQQRFEVTGEAGAVVLDDCAPWPEKLVSYGHSEAGNPGNGQASGPEFIAVDPAYPLRIECEHFLECIATGQTPVTNGIDALDVLKVVLAMRDSALSGQAMKLDHRAEFYSEQAEKALVN